MIDADATDDTGQTALMHAVINNRQGATRALLDHGATLDMTDYNGKTVYDIVTDPMLKIMLTGTCVNVWPRDVLDHAPVVVRREADPDLYNLFKSLDMTEYIPTFAQEKITQKDLVHLTEQDYVYLDVPLGPRRRLQTKVKNMQYWNIM